MNDVILILLAGFIVFSVGLPLVVAYSKWKKEMREAEEEEKESENVDDN